MSDKEREKEKDDIRKNPLFYDKNRKLKSNLTKEEFLEWQKYFVEKEIGCMDFVCVHDSDSCGIYHICHITRYHWYKKAYPEEADKCGMFDKVWKGPEDKEVHYPFKEEDWQGKLPKEACLECTGRYGNYAKEITKEEYDKFKQTSYNFIEEINGKYYLDYHHGWCKEVNDFMQKRGYIVNREFEKYKDNQAAKELLHALPGGPLKAETELLKFQIESPKLLRDFFERLGLDLDDIIGRE